MAAGGDGFVLGGAEKQADPKRGRKQLESLGADLKLALKPG